MVKAKEFWSFVCNDLGYRFFAGIPCKELKAVYGAMDSSIMHYIPAVNPEVALGIASGVWLSGIKSSVVVSTEDLDSMLYVLSSFNRKHKIPVLIILYSEDTAILKSSGIPFIVFDDGFTRLKKSVLGMEKKEVPFVLVIREEIK